MFYKQRASLFYPVTAFTVPTVLTRIPLSLVSAMAYTLITYFTVGFAPDAGRCAIAKRVLGVGASGCVTLAAGQM